MQELQNQRNISQLPVKSKKQQESDDELTMSQRLGRKSFNVKSIREFFDKMAKNPKEKLDGLALEILIRDLVNDLNTKTLTQLNS